MPIYVKQIREECNQMSAGWAQSPDTEFNGITKAEFDADRAEAAAMDAEIEVAEAALRAKKDARDDKYKSLNGKKVKVRKGVEGHKDFGDDHPIYGSMGFVRASERKSSKTNKTPNPGGTPS